MKKNIFMFCMVSLLFVSAVQSAELVKSWEFSNAADVEEWFGFKSPGVMQANGYSGEGVLTYQNNLTAETDPQVRNAHDFYLKEGQAWSTLEFRLRQIDQSAKPVAFLDWSTFVGVYTVDNTKMINAMEIVQNGYYDLVDNPGVSAGHWVTVQVDISEMGSDPIGLIRIDPIGLLPGQNFEIDYVRLLAKSDQTEASAPCEIADKPSVQGAIPGRT